MYAQEKIKPYTGKAEKGKMVKSMFDTISPTYDKLNLLLSWGIDRRWRKALIDSLKPWRPQHILDVATGTGDLAILAAKSLAPQQVTGADFSDGMMEIGREKAAREGLGEVISFVHEDCMNMSFADETFDAVTASFGIRNFQSLDKGLEEGRSARYRRTDHAAALPDEAALWPLLSHHPTALWQSDQP